MSKGVRRCVIDLACRVLQAMLPASLQSWGWAIRSEATAIPNDTRALLFTLSSLSGLLPRAVASHLREFSASLVDDSILLLEGSAVMHIFFDATMHRPRTLGIICAISAALLGMVYMAIAGAPMHYIGVNIGALATGLTIMALFDRLVALGRRWTDGANIAMANMLLATALLGSEVEGATRWMYLGGLAIQPSLILLPIMVVTFAQNRSILATASLIAAAVAMALQPDRAMAGMLALCLITLAVRRFDKHIGLALAASLTSFVATLVRPDRLPAVPYVDQILYSSFEVHIFAGLAVLAGMALLLVPAIVGWNRDADNRTIYAAFGAIWLAVIMAAALGNYPTPIVGYGGSAIIGYVLSLLALPKLSGDHAEVAECRSSAKNGSSFNRHPFVAPA